MEKLKIKGLVHNGEVNLEAENKLILLDFFKDSLTVIDIILQTHKGIKLDIKMGSEESILDVAINDVIKNIKGEFKPYSYQTDMAIDVNLFIEHKDSLIKYLNYDDVETKDDFIRVDITNKSGGFKDVVTFIYNNFVKFITELMIELIPNVSKNYQRINLYRMELVNDFFTSEREKDLYTNLFNFYDSIVHKEYKHVKVVDAKTHKLLGERK